LVQIPGYFLRVHLPLDHTKVSSSYVVIQVPIHLLVDCIGYEHDLHKKTFLILNAKSSQQNSTRYAANLQHNPWDLRTNYFVSLTFSIKPYNSFGLANFHFQTCCDVQELRFLSVFINMPQRPHLIRTIFNDFVQHEGLNANQPSLIRTLTKFKHPQSNCMSLAHTRQFF